MVKTRSGKQYDTTYNTTETQPETGTLIETIGVLSNANVKLEKDLQAMEERFNKAKESYVSALGLLVNRVANHRLLTLCIEKMIKDSQHNAAEPSKERECCVCYETSNMNIICKNRHATCISCLSKMNWSNRNFGDFMDSMRCPCCRTNFVESGRDRVFELAGISFGNTQVRVT